MSSWVSSQIGSTVHRYIILLFNQATVTVTAREETVSCA